MAHYQEKVGDHWSRKTAAFQNKKQMENDLKIVNFNISELRENNFVNKNFKIITFLFHSYWILILYL